MMPIWNAPVIQEYSAALICCSAMIAGAATPSTLRAR